MNKHLLVPDYIFESSWEVCNNEKTKALSFRAQCFFVNLRLI